MGKLNLDITGSLVSDTVRLLVFFVSYDTFMVIRLRELFYYIG